MESLYAVIKVLKHRFRSDLAVLLKHAEANFNISGTYGSLSFSRLTTAEIYAPIQDYERLKDLPEDDKQVIFNAILEVWPPRENDMEITEVIYRLDPESFKDEDAEKAELIQEIEGQINLMISVATGGPRINSVNDQYRESVKSLEKKLQDLSFTNPNPYKDLWDWYGKWSSGDLPTYQSRRKYIKGLYAPLLKRLRQGSTGRGVEVFEDLTGWPKVDQSLGRIRRNLEESSSEEQYQTVGLLCRETLISLAQTVYNAERHHTQDGKTPSKTDAKRMLDAYLAVELAGGANEIARKHAKASLDLANDLQHRRTATFREAALCAEASASVVNIIAILSGQRDP
jgi:hypothetical protein